MFSLKNILLPVDFSDRNMGAAHYARVLASHFHGRISLLHVLEPIALIGGPEVGGASSAGEDRTRRAEAHLETFLSEEFRGLTVSRHLREGEAARQIICQAQEESADLLVMPTHGYGPFRRFLLGSVTAKVLHDADCPVFTGAHLEEAPPPESIDFQRLVCAVDLGPQSKKVVEWAHGMASSFGARLLAIHVTPPPGLAVAGPGEPDPELERSERARQDIEDLLGNAKADAEIRVESGDVAEIIYDTASHRAADLLVIGRGAAKGVAGRLRSDAYTLIRRSPCPVVSV